MTAYDLARWRRSEACRVTHAGQPAGTLMSRMRACLGPVPDRRGESLQIFTTIFIRPMLEFRHPVARIAWHLCREGGAQQRRLIGRGGWTAAENRP